MSTTAPYQYPLVNAILGASGVLALAAGFAGADWVALGAAVAFLVALACAVHRMDRPERLERLVVTDRPDVWPVGVHWQRWEVASHEQLPNGRWAVLGRKIPDRLVSPGPP